MVRLSESEIFGVFAAIELDQRHTVSTVESGVLASAELIKFVGCIFEVVAKGTETYRELLLLLLQVFLLRFLILFLYFLRVVLLLLLLF